MINKKLEELRDKINKVDDEILNLLAARADIVSEIGKEKNPKNNVVDLDREENILNRLLKKTGKNYSKDTIIRIWRELFQASSRLQIKNDSVIKTKRSIENIKVYTGGKSSIVGKNNIIKLSSNESSLGPSPNIRNQMKDEDLSERFHRYPEIDGLSLRAEIAKLQTINKKILSTSRNI